MSTDWKLTSPRQAVDAVARLLRHDGRAEISVCEQVAFKDAPLRFGSIELAPSASVSELKGNVRDGSFIWRVPSEEDVSTQLMVLTTVEDDGKGDAGKKGEDARNETAERKLGAVLNAMATIATRVGIVHPRFDAHCMSGLPFRRPTTIVADTSGVLQGGMDFAANFLQPMARLKIPGILHMEVINQADRFLTTRRAKRAKPFDQLLEHLLSQTGQRALIRLELRDDTEVERSPMLGDPLRSAFRADRDLDLDHLNLNVPHRSYVDRLILESAIQHQARSRTGHPVHLLTSDQGLAKMALAEGVPPLFFKAVTKEIFFGRSLSGANLHPFTGRVVRVPLVAVLWELATAFGLVKLGRKGSDATVSICAIGKDLGWSPFHSMDDLLWCREDGVGGWPEKPARIVPTRSREPQPDALAAKAVQGATKRSEGVARSGGIGTAAVGKGPKPTRTQATNPTDVAFFRLKAQGLVDLVDALATGRLEDAAVGEIVGSQHASGIAEYRRFLSSGDFLEAGGGWIGTDHLVALADAQRLLDVDAMSAILARTPSYAFFLAELGRCRPGEPLASRLPARVEPSYKALAEVTCMGMPIPNLGYVATMNRPTPRDFSRLALETFESLGGEPWASVGEWLERLAQLHGVHPVKARDLMQEATAARMLVLATEGSTTDTRHDDHVIRTLQLDRSRPIVQNVRLYRGDFLLPEKSSISFQLKASAQ